MDRGIIDKIESLDVEKNWDELWEIAQNHGEWITDERIIKIKFGDVRNLNLKYKKFKVNQYNHTSEYALIYSLYGGLQYTKFLYTSLYSMFNNTDLEEMQVPVIVYLRNETNEHKIDINYYIQRKLLSHFGVIIKTIDYYNKARLFAETDLQKFKKVLLLDSDTFFVNKYNLFKQLNRYQSLKNVPKLNFLWSKKGVRSHLRARFNEHMLYHYPESVKKMEFEEFVNFFVNLCEISEDEWKKIEKSQRWGLACAVLVDQEFFGNDYKQYSKKLEESGCICDESILLFYSWKHKLQYSDISRIKLPGLYNPRLTEYSYHENQDRNFPQFIHPFLGGINQKNNLKWIEDILI